MTYRTAALGFGAFFTVIAFICLLIAISTNWWVVIQVDKTNIGEPNFLAGYTRNRGIFKECFEDSKATMQLVKANALADEFGDCIQNDFLINRRPGVTYSANYRMRADLHIAMVVFFFLALLLCVCGFGVFCYAMSMNNSKVLSKKWSLATKWAGILIFVAAFFNALGMAFFHGAEYIETQLIDSNGDEVPYVSYFRSAQPTALQAATTRSYAWSYVLGWLAVFFEVLSAVLLFLCGSCCKPVKRRGEKEFFEVGTMNSARSYGQRNMAYEYVEGKAPVVYEAQPQPLVLGGGGGGYHEHFAGRHFDPYSRGPVHQAAPAQYNYDDGGWRWQ